MTRAILNGYRLKDVATQFNTPSHSTVMGGARTILKGIVDSLPADKLEEGRRMFDECETSSFLLYEHRKYWSPLLAAVEAEWLVSNNPHPDTGEPSNG